MKRGPLIAGLLSVVVIIVLVAAVILPKASQVRSKQAEVAMAQQQEATLQLRLQQLQADAKDAPKDRKLLAKLEASLPPTADLPGLIRLLNGIAADSSVDFMSVSPGQPTASAAGGLSVIPTQISITGRFFSVDQYLFRLEQLPRATKVTSVQLATGAWPTLQLSLAVEFYTTDTSAGPGSIPGPTAGGTGTVVPNPAPAPVPSISASPTPSSSP
jgi:Tfp pilus assembly protein PilO